METIKQALFAAVVDTNPLPTPTADRAAIQTISNVVFTIVGAIALLVIVVAGFRYIVSHGDPGAVAQSKRAIIYALVGLVVSIAYLTIVNFVAVRI